MVISVGVSRSGQIQTVGAAYVAVATTARNEECMYSTNDRFRDTANLGLPTRETFIRAA